MISGSRERRLFGKVISNSGVYYKRMFVVHLSTADFHTIKTSIYDLLEVALCALLFLCRTDISGYDEESPYFW